MTLIASGPVTCGTSGSAGFAGGSGAFSVGYRDATGTGAGAGAGAGSGVGAVAGRGAQAVTVIAVMVAATLKNLVIIMDSRSSLMVVIAGTIPSWVYLFVVFQADLACRTYIPAMLCQDFNTSISYLRARNSGAFRR
jgi:hypothetical protein